MSAPLDHGVLNIPLAKRGNINAQLDAYKAKVAAERRRAEKAARAAHRSAAAEALALIAGVSKARLIELGLPHGLTAAQTRKMLVSMARTCPSRVVSALSREASANRTQAAA